MVQDAAETLLIMIREATCALAAVVMMWLAVSAGVALPAHDRAVIVPLPLPGEGGVAAVCAEFHPHRGGGEAWSLVARLGYMEAWRIGANCRDAGNRSLSLIWTGAAVKLEWGAAAGFGTDGFLTD